MRYLVFVPLFMILGLFREVTFGQQAIPETVDLPDGIYQTKEDFLCATPSSTASVLFSGLHRQEQTDSLLYRCFILDANTGKKLSNVFAVCEQGRLYFSYWAILKNKSAHDKGISPASSMNSFVLVLLSGKNYLYLEAGLINHWRSGLSGGIASGVGGLGGMAIGDAIENSYPSSTPGGTGVVWDFRNEEFNIFRDIKDFNLFLESCGKDKIDISQRFELSQVRAIVQKVK